MTGFLLDTNVISEVSRESPDPQVIRFLTAEGDLWLSSVTVYEMEYGLELLPLRASAGDSEDGTIGHPCGI